MKELKEKLADVERRMLELNEKAKTEKRSLTDEENTLWATMVAERDALNVKIEQEKVIQSIIQTRSQQVPKTPEIDKIKKEFRFQDVIQASLELREQGKTPDGLILEMHQEAEREARESNVVISGVGVPSMLLRNPEREQRDQTAGTPSAGGYTVPTELGSFIDALYGRLKLTGLGAQKLTGLQGSINVPIGTNTLRANWFGETTENTTGKTKSFGQKELSPKRLSAFCPISKRLIIQSSLDIEAYIRDQLLTATALTLEETAIAGSTETNAPDGILTTSGIGSVEIATNGDVPTWAHIVALETAIYNANADVESMGYLTTPGIKGYLKTAAIESGDASKIWPIGSKELNGYKAEVSTLVPSNLSKGTASEICHAIIFGNFKDLVLCQWGGLDVLVDPYTLKKQAMIEVQVDSFHDILIRRAESFAAIVDAETSAS